MANIQDCPGFEPFGEGVKAARKKRRLSRQKVAEMVDISTACVERLCTSWRRPPVSVTASLLLEIKERRLSISQKPPV